MDSLNGYTNMDDFTMSRDEYDRMEGWIYADPQIKSLYADDRRLNAEFWAEYNARGYSDRAAEIKAAMRSNDEKIAARYKCLRMLWNQYKAEGKA